MEKKIVVKFSISLYSMFIVPQVMFIYLLIMLTLPLILLTVPLSMFAVPLILLTVSLILFTVLLILFTVPLTRVGHLVLLRSFKERNILLRSFFLSFWRLMRPKRTMRFFAFFS